MFVRILASLTVFKMGTRLIKLVLILLVISPFAAALWAGYNSPVEQTHASNQPFDVTAIENHYKNYEFDHKGLADAFEKHLKERK